MAGKESKLTIWALDPEISIEDLPHLLNLDYSREIEYLNSLDNLRQHEKTLLHRWMEFTKDNGFNIQTYEILGQTIRCVPAKAFIESSASQDHAVHGSFVLPRGKRIQQSILDVFFFENAHRVYTIVEGPEYKTRYVRSVLMGGGRKVEDFHKRWKKVQIKDIPNYTFSSDFFYWLIGKENQTINTQLFDMQINDIRFLSQSVDRKDIKHESEGANLLDEAVPKTGLGINSRVGQVGTTIICDEGTFRFDLYETGVCTVNNYESAVNSPNGDINPFDQHLDIGSLMLYSVILPSLKSAFNEDKVNFRWTVEHQANSRKTWALGAINELCSENEVSIEEIKGLDWFK